MSSSILYGPSAVLCPSVFVCCWPPRSRLQRGGSPQANQRFTVFSALTNAIVPASLSPPLQSHTYTQERHISQHRQCEAHLFSPSMAMAWMLVCVKTHLDIIMLHSSSFVFPSTAAATCYMY